jgi:hypothetical protein
MRRRFILGAGFLALTWTVGSAVAAAPSSHQGFARPSIRIASVTVSGQCITARVTVHQFKLVAPNYSPHRVAKTKSQGHLHYVLNSGHGFSLRRDATAKLVHTWCGPKQGVKRGSNFIRVILVTREDVAISPDAWVARYVMVK